ncbi:MAG: hypothetical protein KDH88_05600 [Chromatiales bacterium]|nr:hypothetical protein [Chromatiales bacterium]
MTPFASVKHRGFVLVTSLVFLLILTVVAIFALKSTGVQYRMSSNTAFLDRARAASDSGRLALSSVMPEHVYEREWTSVSLATGLTIADKDENNAADDLYAVNSETSWAADGLDVDARYRIDGNGDGDYADPQDIDAAMAVYRTAIETNTGSGQAMLAGYMGLGKAVSAGGAMIFYDIQSRGYGQGNAQARTSADFRAVVQ